MTDIEISDLIFRASLSYQRWCCDRRILYPAPFPENAVVSIGPGPIVTIDLCINLGEILVRYLYRRSDQRMIRDNELQEGQYHPSYDFI